MPEDLRHQLQQTLGAAYTLERELGGGGMSRVFVAGETRLDRKVVVKLLSPELAAGVNVERFEREIRVAASLQQANIVPIFSAGESHGLPYYTMPFVEGESLRARLAKDGALTFTEIVRIATPSRFTSGSAAPSTRPTSPTPLSRTSSCTSRLRTRYERGP